MNYFEKTFLGAAIVYAAFYFETALSSPLAAMIALIGTSLLLRSFAAFCGYAWATIEISCTAKREQGIYELNHQSMLPHDLSAFARDRQFDSYEVSGS